MGLVAREPELADIADVLDRDPADPRALVLVGAPGVGRTTLWRERVAPEVALHRTEPGAHQ